MKNILLLFGIIISISACGPSAEETKKREQFIADSTKAAIEKQEQQRIHQEKIEVGKSIKRTKLNNLLKEVENQLVTEQRNLDEINVFQIGRSSSTKREQVRAQNEVIRQVEVLKKGIEHEISQTHLYESYDFQSSPKGTIEHLIEAAKKEDYSKLRNLVDPYGEFDQDVLTVCLVEMYPSDMKELWKGQFANGRIMGESTVKGDTAKVEIAMGLSSDKLETINLIRRQDKWYLQSF